MDRYAEIEQWGPSLDNLYDDLTPADWWTPQGGYLGSNACNTLKGTDGQQFHPDISKKERLWLFQTDICRSMYGVFKVRNVLNLCLSCTLVIFFKSWELVEFPKFFVPLGRPTTILIILFSLMSSKGPSVPTFQNRAKQNNFQVKIVIVTGGTVVGLAEWIIDDTCFVKMQ